LPDFWIRQGLADVHPHSWPFTPQPNGRRALDILWKTVAEGLPAIVAALEEALPEEEV
jgi:hypothetical protein